MEYTTIFETNGYQLSTFIPELVALLFLGSGIYILIEEKRKKPELRESLVLPIVVICIGVILVSIMGFKLYIEKTNIINPYKNGYYSSVEGTLTDVDNFESSNGVNSFRVEGIEFEIGIDGPGLQRKANDGGPINSEDTYYKITYVTYNNQNYIFKVEILAESN